VRKRAEKLWKVFQEAPPGQRFQRLHDAEKETGGWRGIALALLGVGLILAGIVLLFMPGPGILLIAFGAALVAQRFLWLAKRLDALEVVLHKLARKVLRFWRAASPTVRALVVVVVAAVSAAAVYGLYVLLFRR
jgi:hypothetical protein